MTFSKFSYPLVDLEAIALGSTEEILDFSEFIMSKIETVEDSVLRAELSGICSTLHHLLKEYYRLSGESEHIRLVRSRKALYSLSRKTAMDKDSTRNGRRAFYD